MKSLAILALATSFQAQTLTPLQDSDVYAYLDRPTSSIATLGVNASGTGAPHSQRSLIQFDLSSLPLGPEQLGSAKLRLFVIKPDPTYGNLGTGDVEIFRQGGTWAVATLRWSQLQPAESHGLFAITDDSADQWIEIDVTTLVREWLDGTYPNYGFLLQAAVEDPASLNVTFASMEVPGYRPQLVLTEAEVQPTLFIDRQDHQTVLRWPASTSWTLEQSPSLAPGSWSPVEASPTILDGEAVLELDPPSSKSFFRLNSDPSAD
ncbi:hypothetical protein HNR46_002952 [Haloferula luteola]|uniref:Carbohydrate-binding module family 96 domain-containing protein n=1 Tax=Haloferula luteola TaxID=595692 RepID=A0A840VAX8_9BACT|nr:hypothetical protein [Haloferula luteola]